MQYIIGIDIGGMSAKGGLFDENGTLLLTQTIKTNKQDGFERTVKDLALLCRQLATAYGVSFDTVSGIGVAVPGLVDSKNGVVVSWGNFDWKNAPLAQSLSSYIGKKVVVGNDANLATLGEVFYGVGAKYQSNVLLTLGTGVGSGFVVDGKLFEGYGGMFELGHFVLYPNGLACACGKKGCFEQYASASALISQTKLAMQNNPNSFLWEIVDGDSNVVNGKTVFIGVERDDETAKKVLLQYIEYLAQGIVHIINILHPEAVLIGGGIAGAGEMLLQPLRERIKVIGYSGASFAPVKIELAKLGNQAGIYGALALATKLSKE